jgi:hypothetical protein
VIGAAVAGSLVAAFAADAAAGAAAPAALTLSARPALASPFAPVVVTGRVAGARDGELVSLEVKECGNTNFHVVAGATTAAGGGFSARLFVNGHTQFRARLGSSVSPPVAVRGRSNLVLYRLRGRRALHVFGTLVSPWQSMRGRALELQRFDRERRGWVPLRRRPLVYRSQGRWEAHFRVTQRGQTIRVFLPRDQAGPCYLPTASNLVRIRERRG